MKTSLSMILRFQKNFFWCNLLKKFLILVEMWDRSISFYRGSYSQDLEDFSSSQSSFYFYFAKFILMDWVGGSSGLSFHKPSRWFCWRPQFKNHNFRAIWTCGPSSTRHPKCSQIPQVDTKMNMENFHSSSSSPIRIQDQPDPLPCFWGHRIMPLACPQPSLWCAAIRHYAVTSSGGPRVPLSMLLWLLGYSGKQLSREQILSPPLRSDPARDAHVGTILIILFNREQTEIHRSNSLKTQRS